VSRPLLIDLYCCAGGASMGYFRAGFDVVGVDLHPQPNYPFEFVQADALEFVAKHGAHYRGRPIATWGASPPCQFATAYRRRKGVALDAVNLIPDTRAALVGTGLPYVIENVEQARPWLIADQTVKLCGSAFGLDVQRHRLFESNLPLASPGCDHAIWTPKYPPATNRTNLRKTMEIGVWRIPLADQQREMGIDWATLQELSQAIPPVYTEHLGHQILAQLAAWEGEAA
jgi:DNA (cytosine-5)-methyltransferase 1